MGEVYKAVDTRLDRTVAIKMLHADHVARFEREARTIAALNHPHICQLYDIGPDYLVMEFVDGAPLRGPMPLDEALRFAGQICDALEAAHLKSIVHRDLKPANILLSASGVKLVDFGLALSSGVQHLSAHATQGTPATDITQAGTIVGTAAYMSPEQATGEHVDERSDIFSFGAVLYEMVSGRQAFRGNTVLETISAVLRDDPVPLDTLPTVAAIVNRCFSKSAADRFPTIRQVRDAIRQAGARAPEATPSIAVLPFANLSADPEQEYFSDGLADEIINALAKIQGLKVIARTSAFAFKGQHTDIRKIAERLSVANILEGSVRRSGNRIRVTVQLAAAADGVQLWSERYDREIADVFEVQDEIATAIAGALRVKLSGEPQARRYEPKLPAYDAYLHAKHQMARVRPESMERARRYYESAIQIDSGFGLAHVGIGFYWLSLSVFGRCSAHEVIPQARAAARRALQCDDSLPEAHALLGFVAACYDLDWKTAELHFDIPLAKQVGFPLVRPAYGSFQFFRGNVEQAVAIAESAVADDPLEAWPHLTLHAYLQGAGRDREAYDQALKALDLDDHLVVARVSIAHFHAEWGQLAEATAAARLAHEIAPWYPDATATLAALLRRGGQESEARLLYESIGTGKHFGDARVRAIYHLLCNEIEAAADWVEKAIEQRDHSMMFHLRFVVCRPLRASARWPKIARMVNLPDWRP